MKGLKPAAAAAFHATAQECRCQGHKQQMCTSLYNNTWVYVIAEIQHGTWVLQLCVSLCDPCGCMGEIWLKHAIACPWDVCVCYYHSVSTEKCEQQYCDADVLRHWETERAALKVPASHTNWGTIQMTRHVNACICTCLSVCMCLSKKPPKNPKF